MLGDTLCPIIKLEGDGSSQMMTTLIIHATSIHLTAVMDERMSLYSVTTIFEYNKHQIYLFTGLNEQDFRRHLSSLSNRFGLPGGCSPVGGQNADNCQPPKRDTNCCCLRSSKSTLGLLSITQKCRKLPVPNSELSSRGQ